MKIFKIIFFHLRLAIILSLAGLIYFFTLTTPGLQYILEMISASLPGKLHIQHYEGSLLTGFSLQDLAYTDTQQQTTIGTLQIDWSLKQLLRERIILKNIFVNHVRIHLQETKQSNNNELDWSGLHYLTYFILKRLEIKDLLVDGTLKSFPIKSSVNILFENNTLNIHDTQLQIANSTIALKGTVKQFWDIQWQVHAPDINAFVPQLQGKLSSNGMITGNVFTPRLDASLAGNNIRYYDQKIEKIIGSILLNFNNKEESHLNLTLQQIKIQNYTLKILKLTTSGKIFNDKLFSQIHLLVNNNQNQLTGNLTLPKFQLFDFSQPINGHFNLRFTDFNTLVPPTPYAKHLRGLLTGQAEISGTLDHPIFSSDLSLTDGHIKITKLGIKINDLKLNAHFNDKNLVQFSGGCRAGKGTAKFLGDINLTSRIVKIGLQGDNLKIINTPEYRILASPTLTLTLNQQEILLAGKIFIPFANIKPNAFSTTVTLPNDVVFVGQPQATSILPTQLSMQIKLTLGDEINFSYPDLKAQLAGKLSISQTPGSLTIAAGELYIRKGTGTYRAYGQILKLQQGRLIYTGNAITNPGLDIRAGKRIKTVSAVQSTYTGLDQITVGVQVNGTLNHPVVTLFSDAGLSNEDILSYILFGYPKSQISGASSLNLLSAASSSLSEGGTSRIGNVTEKLQNALGLTELTTESTEVFNPSTNTLETTTTVGVGKKLARNLYLHYSVGLFSPVSILNLRYQFSKHWAIQTETSTIDNGADLLYGFEHD